LTPKASRRNRSDLARLDIFGSKSSNNYCVGKRFLKQISVHLMVQTQ
jgi:hypothetical protein